jgi:hypothetical protein
MKLALHSKVMALVLFLLPAGSALAGTDAHKGGLSITGAVQVGSTQLAAGDYAVKWDGAGPNVQLSILRAGKVVATAPARVVDLGHKAAYNSAETAPGSDGTRSLTRLQFEGKTFALEIGGGDTASSDAKSSGDMK